MKITTLAIASLLLATTALALLATPASAAPGDEYCLVTVGSTGAVCYDDDWNRICAAQGGLAGTGLVCLIHVNFQYVYCVYDDLTSGQRPNC